MVLDRNKKIEIKTSAATVIALLLMAVYFIKDYLDEKQLLVAGIYLIIIGAGIYLCSKSKYVYENLYGFICLIVLSNIMKYSVPHFKKPIWLYNTLLKQFQFSSKTYTSKLLATPYLYIYLIGVLLLIIYKFAPKLCESQNIKHVFQTLGSHAVWATVMHMCAVCFSKSESFEDAIFVVFIVSAFWSAYTKDTYEKGSVLKAIWLLIEIFVFMQLYSKQYIAFIERIQDISNMVWFYSVGICIISVICLLSDEAIQDNIVGLIILATNIICLFGKNNNIVIEPLKVLLFHVLAASLFYTAKTLWNLENTKRKQLQIYYGGCYPTAFLFTIFLQFHYVKPLTILCIGLLVMLIYFGNIIKMKGSIYGTIVVGVIPWLLLETTMDSIGKLHSSLITIVLFTIMFWCVASVALSWKDNVNIKAIVFDKVTSEKIINGLSLIACLLTVTILFI